MPLSDNNPHITLDDIQSGLRFVLVNTHSGIAKRGTFRGEPFENSREEHVVKVEYDGDGSHSEVELACFGLAPSNEGAWHTHLVLLAEYNS